MKHDYLDGQKSKAPRTIGLLILILFVFMLGWHSGITHVQSSRMELAKGDVLSPSGRKEEVNMQLFWDAWNVLAARFVDPHLLDVNEMVYGSIRGMVASVGDPYTVFMTPKENKEFQDNLDGKLEGIGAELTLRHGVLTVVSPLKGSPAGRAGLLPEDIIYKIDGAETDGMSLEEAVSRIRGPRGQAVTLTLLREGEEEPFDLKIVREEINVRSVDFEFKGDYAVIELNQFGTDTMQDFSNAINEILKRRPKGIVLDMRYNGGGYLEGAIDIVSEFIPTGKVVTIKKRNPDDEEAIFVNGKARVVNVPLAVLINRGSASASEIVAGALQDYERGVIIGERSFGKGTVQEVQNLVGGSSLRVTIAKWFTPNDRNITESGIEPDLLVERTPEDIEEGRDPQLDKALEWLKKQ